ncbi:MAG: ligase-associated DNA damage response exonuclease [Saprospiraceae bacterium]|nr:ligase-associated DNA damage response exonuclease [Saprospiraceae bacterium]
MTASANDLLVFSPQGIYCPKADIYIDPWKPVQKAIITHGHSDHARKGHEKYICAPLTLPVLRHRLGKNIQAEALPFGKTLTVHGVHFSLHPAGHIPGSAQVRVEHKGEVWVVTGDYKLHSDPISEPFESVYCHTMITESTFGLPIYQWSDPKIIIQDIHTWWRDCQAKDHLAVIHAYSLGKAQRLIAELDNHLGPIFTHKSIEPINEIFRRNGLHLPQTTLINEAHQREDLKGGLLLAPPSALNSDELQRFGPISDAMASGWMSLRKGRFRRTADRGFALSDHVDWPGLLSAIRESRAERVLVTHGFSTQFARYLREIGLDALAVDTRFQGEPAPDDTTDEDAQIHPV